MNSETILIFLAIMWVPSLVIAALSYFEVACLSFRDWKYERHAKRIIGSSARFNKRH